MQTATLYSSLTKSSFLRFAAVGALGTALDLIVLNALHKAGTSVPVATALGFLAGLTSNYFLNSRFVFATDRTVSRYAKYFAVSLGGLAITEFIVNFLHARFAVAVLAAKLVAVFVVFFWNYLLSKTWAFK